MGRLPRAIDDGLAYLALNRGNNRAAIFADDDDHLAFLQALAATKERFPFRLLGYCLMTNNSICFRGPSPVNQSAESSNRLPWPTPGDTTNVNTARGMWQGRFKSPVIQDDMHLLVVLRYIEANPLRARMVADPADYRWSSYQQQGWDRTTRS